MLTQELHVNFFHTALRRGTETKLQVSQHILFRFDGKTVFDRLKNAISGSLRRTVCHRLSSNDFELPEWRLYQQRRQKLTLANFASIEKLAT